MRRLVALTEDADFVCYRYRLAAFAGDLAAAGWNLEPWPRRRGLADFAALLRAIRGADACLAGSDHPHRAADDCGGAAPVHVIPTCVDPTRYRLAGHDRSAGVPARHSAWSAASEADELARAGLPVVANAIGIHRHLIDHGRTGFLADTPAEWRRAIATLAADPHLRRTIGRSARQRLERHWSTQAWGPRLVGILGRVAGGSLSDPSRSTAA